MNKRKTIRVVSAVFSLSMIVLTQTHYGYAADTVQTYRRIFPSFPVPEVERFKERIYADLAPSKAIQGYFLDGQISRKGIATVNTIKSNNRDPQSDADCLMAIMGASASVPITADWVNVHFHFDIDTHAGHTGNGGIAKYFSTHPKQEHTLVAFYRIPLDVLKRYPGLFTEDELLADANIGTIKTSGGPGLSASAIKCLKTIYLDTWIPFFVGASSATKQQILEIRDKLPFDERHPNPMKPSDQKKGRSQ